MSIGLGKPLFEMCCFHMGIARKACQNGLGHFFPTLPRGVRACQDGLGHFFSTFARLPEGGGGSKAIWAMPIQNQNIYKRGFPYHVVTR